MRHRPPGSLPLSVFDILLGGITVRGSIVGTRPGLQEALVLAGEDAVQATVHRAQLEDINDVFEWKRAGQIEGRVVLDFGK